MTITTAQDPKQQHREEIKRAKFFHKISSHPANIDKPQFKEKDTKHLLNKEINYSFPTKRGEVHVKGTAASLLFRGNAIIK